MSAAILALIPFLRSYGFIFNQTISADTSNYNLRAAAVAAGWDQVAPLYAVVTINSGIVVSATTTAQYAFDTGAVFPAGSTLALINNGYVIGMGGAGGLGANYGDRTGQPGGPALRAQAAISITNGGTLGGGGGGGGGGSTAAGGGGGRTGRTDSLGGTFGGGNGSFTVGGDGRSGGSGGTTGPGGAGTAGTAAGGGGGWGASGGTGSNGAAAAGAGGAAVIGNSNITWVSTGTRYGAIT